MGQGSNSSGLRQYNERAVLAALRHLGEASKADLARRTGLTPQGVTRLIGDLEKAQLVVQRGKRMGGKGQPSLLYAVNPEGAYALGAKIGRSDLELVLSDFGGRILGKLVQEYDYADPDLILDMLARGTKELRGHLKPGERRKITGLGLGMPWFIGEWMEQSRIPPELASRWEETDLAGAVAKRTQLDVFLENDVTSAALAELHFGAGTRLDNFLYIYLDTFIGGGLVLEGELETGVHANAGAVYCMPVPASKLPSATTGSKGVDQLLNRASLFVLLQHLKYKKVQIDTVSELPRVIDESRQHVQDWLEDAGDALVYALQSAVGLLDLEAVIIDSFLPAFLVDELAALVGRRLAVVMPRGIFVPEVMSGQVGADAMALGAAMLPIYSRFAPDKTVLLKGGVPERVPAS